MKNRLLWLAVVIAASAGFYFAMVKPALEPPQPAVSIDDSKKLRPPPPLPPPELPPLAIPEPVISPPEVKPLALPDVRNAAPSRSPSSISVVPIQDGATIDFSYGAPQIKVQGKDAEELEKALKEMREATKDQTFPPTKP